jgi:hypothetical protein
MSTVERVWSFRVGVCELNSDGRYGRGRPLVAYTRPWNLDRLCIHLIEATSGTKAKQAAIRAHRATCMTAPARPEAGA